MRRRSRKLLARTASLLAAGLVVAGTPAAAHAATPSAVPAVPTGRIGLPGTAPPWATAQADQGQAPTGTTVTAHVYLAGRDRAGLEAAARSVSDPASAEYGRYLTPAQVQARYGATPGRQAAVRDWLTGAGFRVTAADAHQLTVQGSPKAVSAAFGTTLHRYRKGGHVYTAPVTAASVPADMADAVLTVTGLEDTPHLATPKAVSAASPGDQLPGPTAAFVNAPPFSTSWGERPAAGVPQAYGAVPPYAVQGYTGRQLRSAYGVTGSGLSGRGVTVAVVDAYHSPTLTADAETYARRNGDAPYRAGQLTTVDAPAWTDTDQCGADGWYGEQSLDVEAAHAMAQDAGITYVGAASCDDPDLLAALNTVVDHHLADIVSDSWGEPESAADPALDPAYDQTFATGALEGIGFYFSSGDDGDDKASTGTKQSETPASRPWVTAVGGTSLAVGADDGYQWETGWGTDNSRLNATGTAWSSLPGTFDDGAGGGASTRAAQPWYQRGVVPAALARQGGGRAMRTVPDIAAVADPTTGFLIGQTQSFPDGTVKYSEFRIGGTSLAAPVIAGIQALAQQAQGFPIGFANPRLYDQRHAADFHDVTDHPLGADRQLAAVRVDYRNGVDDSAGTSTTLQTLGHDSSLAAVPGYDEVTGVGSPAPAYLRSFRLLPVRR